MSATENHLGQLNQEIADLERRFLQAQDAVKREQAELDLILGQLEDAKGLRQVLEAAP